MNNIFQNFASKKFFALLAVIWILLDTSQKRPELTELCLWLMCGLAVVYSILEIMDKVIEFKFGCVEEKDGLPNPSKP